jgi:hypothetical protein
VLESRSDLNYGCCMPDGLVTVRSAFDPAETKARLLAVLKDKGVTVFANIPHAKGAAQAGLLLPRLGKDAALGGLFRNCLLGWFRCLWLRRGLGPALRQRA